MKRILPRSLLGSNLLLLAALIVGSQACAMVIFLGLIQGPRVDEAADLVASQVVLADRLLAALPSASRQQMLLLLSKGAAVPADYSQEPPQPGYVLHRFFSRLKAHLPPGVELSWKRDDDRRRLWLRVHSAAGTYWTMLPAASPYDPAGPGLILQLLTLATFPILGAYLIHRRTERPLRRLAQAASMIGQGQWPKAVSVDGPLEISTVANAFNGMVSSLVEIEATRAEMLAGISHDVRTPLTKLRMAITAPEAFEAPVASAERYVEEIDVIMQQFIDYARGASSEVAAQGDVNFLVEQLAADYAGLGQDFALSLLPLPRLAFKPVALQRLIMNLMQNAAVHGQVGLSVSTRADRSFVVVMVEDRGPGVPEETLSLIKQPFRRGGRSDEKGGTGLGLAIADRIARQHGGRLDLSRREGGGLSAAVWLPCE